MSEIEINEAWLFPDPRAWFGCHLSSQFEPREVESRENRVANLYRAQAEYDSREYNKFLRKLDPIEMLNELGFEDDAIALESYNRMRHAAEKAAVTQGDPTARAELAAKAELQRQRKAKSAERAKKYRMNKKWQKEGHAINKDLEQIEIMLRDAGIEEQYIPEQAWKLHMQKKLSSNDD
jgi:hypothetical protein